ncbi:hypothetical protein PVAP13_6KG151754 [Panicum virgatum]|uniref:Uncharacterized protein n=1 Tax=Panicum virgatum TaxID=38727 RepID=A0A8T0RE37_PANVG|nr:hypothetical protein PVAP13_6KG151754 [Panicum virgatum]
MLSFLFTRGVDSTPPVVINGTSSQLINIGDDTSFDYPRTEKCMLGTKDEDIILINVTAAYNSAIPKNRASLMKCVKDRFGRIKKKGCMGTETLWGEHKKDGPFMFKPCWDVLRKEPKCDAYLECLANLDPEKRKFNLEDDVGLHFSLLVDAQNKANEGQKEMLDTQKCVSSENLEARKFAYLATKESKESDMLETYRDLLKQDTTVMAEDVRSEHVLALRCFREKLFGNTN